MRKQLILNDEIKNKKIFENNFDEYINKKLEDSNNDYNEIKYKSLKLLNWDSKNPNYIKGIVKLEIIEDSDWRVPKDYELEEWYNLINVENYKTEGFEGAVVLDPKPGIYLDDPVSVLDYASLYPSSIIEKNLSHETYVEDKDLIEEIGYDNLHKIEYENFLYQSK